MFDIQTRRSVQKLYSGTIALQLHLEKHHKLPKRRLVLHDGDPTQLCQLCGLRRHSLKDSSFILELLVLLDVAIADTHDTNKLGWLYTQIIPTALSKPSD